MVARSAGSYRKIWLSKSKNWSASARGHRIPEDVLVHGAGVGVVVRRQPGGVGRELGLHVGAFAVAELGLAGAIEAPVEVVGREALVDAGLLVIAVVLGIDGDGDSGVLPAVVSGGPGALAGGVDEVEPLLYQTVRYGSGIGLMIVSIFSTVSYGLW